MKKLAAPSFLILLFVMVSLSCTNPIKSYFATQTAKMWTLTPTATSTSTPTDTPTNTPPSTPTPEYLFQDDFGNLDSGWEEADDDVVVYQYSDGGYQMKLKQPNYYAWSFSPTGRNYKDIALEVDATKIAGVNNTKFGFIARFVDRDNFYIFFVSNNGIATIMKKVDGDYRELKSDRIDGVKSNQLNHIAAICKGEDLELYVNGDLVLSDSDSDFAKGEVGLIIGSGNIGTSDVLFDNFVIRPA
jgi:dipeptidyl aminopeptidase/acylaminoacyl peptidase